MKETIYNNLLKNRLLKDVDEIAIFEESLNELKDNFNEDDIVKLFEVLDDKTENTEVMFGVIHLIETLSSEQAFFNTIEGIVKLKKYSPEWAKIIVYRCLNDLFSIEMLKKIIPNLNSEMRTEMCDLLMEIKAEDEEKFGEPINQILI